ncbi:DinB family protein [Polaribacter sp. Asnod6-C07]|uniref:DinB family protein n=1 Tax=Polaribacter sp. Asnod6-C07 TaxID=3160582 RepID=UPI0038647B6A
MIPENEYAPYYKQYVKMIESNGKSLLDNLYDSQKDFENTLRYINKEKGDFAYAEGKWTLKELIQHVIDTERVFCYRALCFARNDKTELPGFDQDLFADHSKANQREYYDILDEMDALRISTIHLFESFSDKDLLKIGIGSGNKMSVRALGFIFSGHQTHHLNIVKERYL